MTFEQCQYIQREGKRNAMSEKASGNLVPFKKKVINRIRWIEPVGAKQHFEHTLLTFAPTYNQNRGKALCKVYIRYVFVDIIFNCYAPLRRREGILLCTCRSVCCLSVCLSVGPSVCNLFVSDQ